MAIPLADAVTRLILAGFLGCFFMFMNCPAAVARTNDGSDDNCQPPAYSPQFKTVSFTMGGTTITSNGEEMTMPAEPYTDRGIVMVPLESVCEALGVVTMRIRHEASGKELILVPAPGKHTLVFTVGSNTVRVDGKPELMSEAATLAGGLVFVPFHSLGEALDIPVDWDADTNTAFYNLPEPFPYPPR